MRVVSIWLQFGLTNPFILYDYVFNIREEKVVKHKMC